MKQKNFRNLILAAVLAGIGLVGLVMFGVVTPRLRLSFPRILQDVLVAGAAIAEAKWRRASTCHGPTAPLSHWAETFLIVPGGTIIRSCSISSTRPVTASRLRSARPRE